MGSLYGVMPTVIALQISRFLMKGLVRKELGEMLVCEILWLAWMKEHHLEQVIKRL